MCADDDLIFISIAAYRDRQLNATVLSCLQAATHPDRLRFGICWQHDSTEQPPLADDRLRVLDIPWQGSGGACWARAEVMKLWKGEPWYLQLDSHCRMRPGWDTLLIDTAKNTGSEKPVLSTYATPFTPGDNEVLQPLPLQMALQGFTREGVPHFRPVAIPYWESRTRPLRARFLSAGFLFAPGAFVEEIPYDPQLYFLGEEAAMTLRAFTHGYDLYHPAEAIVWHDYIRAEHVKHWDDHVEAQTTQTWQELDLVSKQRVSALLAGQPLDGFNLGTVRTLLDYERYAGLSFDHRKAQGYTMRAEEPPNPAAPEDWNESVYEWIVRLPVPVLALAPGAWDDVSFWYIGVFDELDNEIYRKDLSAADVAALNRTESEMILVCELQSESIPVAWKVWPVSRTAGWLTSVGRVFQEGDYAVLQSEDAASTAT